MKKNKYGCGLIVTILAIAFAIDMLVAWIFQYLWNFVMPIFGITTLNYWKAFAIWFLIGLVGSCFKLGSLSKD